MLFYFLNDYLTYMEVTVHNYKDTWYMNMLLQITFNVYLNSVLSVEEWTETGEKLDWKIVLSSVPRGSKNLY